MDKTGQCEAGQGKTGHGKAKLGRADAAEGTWVESDVSSWRISGQLVSNERRVVGGDTLRNA